MSLTSPIVSSAEGSGTNVKRGSARISAKAGERAVVQQAFASDPKYKKYTQQVDKCLNSFDNVHEWADCIAFLKQLLKTFQSYMQFKEIPRKLIVAKRLSQCLNPALPTGVHQRALDVYSHILAVLGSEGLRADLPLWSSGLFPFFEYAATSVKPTLLNLYDTHYLPLQAALRPIMKSFILALLPGLEEETGEFFEKVLSLLDRLSGTVSQSFFFQNIWLIMLTTPSARGTALNFLARRLPHLNANEDITEVVGKDIGLMIRAFAAALEDENLLVRRGALDLLLQSMKVNSAAVSRAQPDDRAILMRAATGVVLRRDLSLTRRLYTWLLGTDDKSENQIAYFKENALDLLCSTLKSQMNSPPGEYSESRPFKIYISLLDKWEIGAPLTEVLIYDSFKAIKSLIEINSDGSEDMTMTASTLYEAVEPRILWKHMFSAVLAETTGDGSSVEAIQMFHFILSTFSQDEELQTIHLPILFDGLVDIVTLQLCARESMDLSYLVLLREYMQLLDEMLHHIPQSSMLRRPELTGSIMKSHETRRPYAFACHVYGTDMLKSTPQVAVQTSTVPFASIFANLSQLSLNLAEKLAEGSKDIPILRELLSQSLLLMDRLIGRLSTQMLVSWEPAKWLSVLLHSLDHESANFVTVDRTVTLLIALYQTEGLEPRPNIDDRTIIYKMVNKLLQYLHSDFAVYHVRAANLIWSLEAVTKRSHVESILAQSMTSPEYRNVHQSYEAFGNLWRLTEDNLLPGFRFKVPMMIVLDTLKSDDPSLRRIGETWMRCSLKSYLRVLDPIIYELLDPAIQRGQSMMKVKGRELQIMVYERHFDQRYINHLLETLLSIVRFGGQGFTKTAKATPIRRSHHSGLVQRVESSGIVDPEANYLDVLIELLLRFLRSEPKQAYAMTMQPGNVVIQSTVTELLQTIIARGELDAVVDGIEPIIVRKLYYCVHLNKLDLQNKLLHLLHSLLSALTSQDQPSRSSAKSVDPGYGTAPSVDRESGPPSYSVNLLLTQTLIDGISVRTNRPVLQHWLDFVLMAIPQFQPAMQPVIGPLNDCLCRQLISSLLEISSVSVKDDGYARDISSTTTDADMIMLLNGLERMVLLNLSYATEADASDEGTPTAEKSGSENTGILGYVSNVFGSDSVPNLSEEQLTARSPAYKALDEGIRVLFTVWGSLAGTGTRSWPSIDETLMLIYSRTRTRCRRVLEHLFRVHSAEVFESIVDCWSRTPPSPNFSPDVAFELVDILIASAQSVVHMVCESITCRVAGISERSKKQAINPNLSDVVLFRFLEQYLRRLEGPLAVQVWGRFVQLLKEATGSTRDFKAQNFPALSCLVVLADKVTQTTAIEDKRIRKELQDNFARLLDSSAVFVGKATDQGSWIRRTTKESLIGGGRDSPAPRNDPKLEEKLDTSTTTLPPETPKPTAELIIQINQFIASLVLPNLRRFLIDNDRIASACANMVYYIVNPALRGKSRPLDVDNSILGIIREMSRIPAGLKAWRGPVVELLNDNRLFNSNADTAEKWEPVVKSLFDADKTAFPELLSKVTTAPSANIFTNKEYEMLLRSLNVRRLSYVILSAEKNHFLTQLPIIQEKLVDILKNVSAPIVQSEVFLCVRVLLCRLSPHNLTSFWPVLLTELYRIFEQIMTSLPTDASDDLQLVLAASKCLDLLITLQTEEFQIHQWIFITDTVDAVYRPDDWFPEAMMDQLAEIVGALPAGENGNATPNQITSFGDQRAMRKPILNSIRQIESIRDLVPFFSNVSLLSYESVYASGGSIDWEAVERGVLEDMFDGR